MKEFIDLFNILKNKDRGYRLEIGYSPIADWGLRLFYGDVNKQHTIFSVEAVETNLLFAEAYCKLAEYMSETFGGY